MIKLYDFPLSGNAHRVRLMLSLLDLQHESILVKLDEAENLGDVFTDLNPFQQIPVLDDDGFIVRDSVAILCYLAKKYGPQWYPQDAKSIARIHEWLSIVTKEIAAGPASARLVKVFGAKLNHAAVIEQSNKLLSIINVKLEGEDWIAIDKASIADIAAYTYIAHAPEGGVSLAPYSNIIAWLSRIEALPGFVAMMKFQARKAS